MLLVYALSVVGEDALDPSSVVSKPLAYVFAAGYGWLLSGFCSPCPGKDLSFVVSKLATVLWEQRVLDVWIQIALIFSGVMGSRFSV